jgi:hypothetical protein
MKISRLGYTEGSLLFIYWLNNYSNIKLTNESTIIINNTKKNMLNWLHTTSGFYDKKVKGDYFNFNFDNYDESLLNNYLIKIINSIKDSDILCICLHNFNNDIISHKDSFYNFFCAKKNSHIHKEYVYDIMKNKNVLIVSPFAKLIKQQIDNKNVKKIYNNFHDVNNIIVYTAPYTFFNNGPDNNILETCKKIYIEIEKIENTFDVAIISFGAYSNILAEYINTILNKSTCVVGGDLNTYFGIASKRFYDFNKGNIENKEYWIIDIPDEYKPNDYKKIENGCYW